MVLLNPEIITFPSVRPPALSLSIMGRNCSAVHGIGPPPMSTYSTPNCLTARMAPSLRSRPFTGAPILGVLGPSLGIPGPRFQVFSAATDKPGATAAATDPAAACLSKLRREREELICAPSNANSWDRATATGDVPVHSLLVFMRLCNKLI